MNVGWPAVLAVATFILVLLIFLVEFGVIDAAGK